MCLLLYEVFVVFLLFCEVVVVSMCFFFVRLLLYGVFVVAWCICFYFVFVVVCCCVLVCLLVR